MTQKVNPSFKRQADSFKTAGSIALAGGSSEGWISPAAEPSIISEEDADIDETALDAFAETSSGTSLDVTIAPGEAFVYGSWLAIDSSTTVTLSSSTAAQTVYVGWQEGVADTVIIGLDSAFSATDAKIPAYDFTTDADGVTSVTDRRELGQYQRVSHAEIAEELGIPVYADSSNAPQDEGNVIFIDGSGTQTAGLFVHDGSSYREGGNTDEEVQDIVGSLLVGGTNVSLTYDDSANTLTIDTSALNQEEVEDTVDALITDGNAINTTYDDAVDELTIAVVENDITLGNLSGDTDGVSEGTSNLYYTNERVDDEVNSLISDGNAISSTYDDGANTLTIAVTETDISLANLAGDTDNVDEGTTNLYFTDERAQDAVGTITSGGDKITATYDDSANTLTIDTTALDEEEVEDAVNTLIADGTAISTTYDDSGDTLTIDVDPSDDEEITFGTGNDVTLRYDSTNDDIRWQDNTNTTDRMALDRTTGNLNITGEITENASL